MANSPIVIGIDPGTVVTGFGVVALEGSRLIHLDSGVVRTSPSEPMEKRLEILFTGLSQVIVRNRPTEAAIESLFHARSPSTGLKLGQARGVALLAAARGGLTVFEYAPSAVKKAVVGFGGAEKSQVHHMVSALLAVKLEGPLDVTDALALAICHIHTAPFRAQEARIQAILGAAPSAKHGVGRKKR